MSDTENKKQRDKLCDLCGSSENVVAYEWWEKFKCTTIYGCKACSESLKNKQEISSGYET
jgi:hypothetical protein